MVLFNGRDNILVNSLQKSRPIALPIITGNPNEVLAQPNSVVLTKSIAERLIPAY